MSSRHRRRQGAGRGRALAARRDRSGRSGRPSRRACGGGAQARRRLLITVRSATALAALRVGDVVRITEQVSPRYVLGMHGTIMALDDHAATVRLERPVGRFASGHVRCPPLTLEKLPTG